MPKWVGSQQEQQVKDIGEEDGSKVPRDGAIPTERPAKVRTLVSWPPLLQLRRIKTPQTLTRNVICSDGFLPSTMLPVRTVLNKTHPKYHPEIPLRDSCCASAEVGVVIHVKVTAH